MVPIAVGTESVAHGERRRQVLVVGTTAASARCGGCGGTRPVSCRSCDFERGAPVVVLGNRVARELFPARDAVGQVCASAAGAFG